MNVTHLSSEAAVNHTRGLCNVLAEVGCVEPYIKQMKNSMLSMSMYSLYNSEKEKNAQIKLKNKIHNNEQFKIKYISRIV